MFKRNRERFEDCLKRVNVLPLGSAAIAGTTLPINRKYIARFLNFPVISRNSIDAVSDRDFGSDEFKFIELPDAYSTGSSIMPQKKNPDVPELNLTLKDSINKKLLW